MHSCPRGMCCPASRDARRVWARERRCIRRVQAMLPVATARVPARCQRAALAASRALGGSSDGSARLKPTKRECAEAVMVWPPVRMSPDDGRGHAWSLAASRQPRRNAWRVAAVGDAHALPHDVWAARSREIADGENARLCRWTIDGSGSVGAVVSSGQGGHAGAPRRRLAPCDRLRAHGVHSFASRLKRSVAVVPRSWSDWMSSDQPRCSQTRAISSRPMPSPVSAPVRARRE